MIIKRAKHLILGRQNPLNWVGRWSFYLGWCFLTRNFQFSLDKAEIGSLSAGDPRASSSSFLALRGLAWLADPAGVSPFPLESIK
jgi:hypothetical protein